MFLSKLFRNLPVFRGKQRLGKLLFRQQISRGNDLMLNGKNGLVYLVPNIKETVSYELFINGIYEKSTIDFIRKRVEKDGVFVDLGANIGAISVPVGKLRSDLKIYCLEAAPWLFEYLKANIKANRLGNIDAYNYAITEFPGQKLPFYSPKEKFGKGSLAPIFTQEAVMVDTISLDEFAVRIGRRINFLKVDIEGFEYFAFKGGLGMLTAADGPDILFEFADWAEDLAPGIKAGEAQRILIQFGYTLFRFEEGSIGEALEGPGSIGSSMIFATKKAK